MCDCKQVGVLIALAVVLRAKPVLALHVCGKILAAGQQYSSQQRMPFLLWALSQASRYVLHLGCLSESCMQPYLIYVNA